MLKTPSQSVTHDIHQHILSQRGKPSDWYVGIASDTDRLFVDHNVPRENAWWIHRMCETAEIARAVEKAFLDWGCKGGGGGGDYTTKIVYAYLITTSTRE